MCGLHINKAGILKLNIKFYWHLTFTNILIENIIKLTAHCYTTCKKDDSDWYLPI